jgi:hypothetical protein
MNSKGLQLTFAAMIVGFFALMAIVFIYLLFIAKVQDLHVIVKSSDAEIHSITLAQLLLSSDKLVYKDDYRTYRAVFDKDKLDSTLTKVEWIMLKDYKNIAADTGIWYPNAIAIVVIKDLENGYTWGGVIKPPTVSGTAFSNLISCLDETVKVDLGMFFRPFSGLFWEWQDLYYKCPTESVLNRVTPSSKNFPATIRVSDSEIHPAVMVVQTTEVLI